MRFFSIAVAVVSALALTACAPQATSGGTAAGAARNDAFPMKFGESWTLEAVQADASESKELTFKLLGEPTLEKDRDGDTYLFAEASAGEFDAAALYYTDDQFLGITVILENKRSLDDAKAVFCFFQNATSGKARLRGSAFIGTSKALRSLQDRSGLGECTLSRR